MTQRRSWTEREDRILKILREDEKIKKWSEIAKRMETDHGVEGRNQKQCRQRYQNHLNSQIITEKLNEEEEAKLFQLHDEHGNKWSIIANNFSGRTDNTLKNHFHSKLRGAIRKVNRYLGCKKKKGVKSYPLSIVYSIVKFFGQNGKDLLDDNEYDMVRALKNGLLKFSGANVLSSDIDFDEKNEKKHAQKLVTMLEQFQQIIKPTSKRQFSQISEEKIYIIKEKISKHQQQAVSNNYKKQFCLFKTFSQNSFIQKRCSLRGSEAKIETPITKRPHALNQLTNTVATIDQGQLQFQKMQLRKKKSSYVSIADSDLMKLVREGNISNLPFPKIQRLSSFGSYSMEMIDENNMRRNDSLFSRTSNIWPKDLQHTIKLDSCIFE